MDTIELKIEGTSCGSCVSSITHALQRVPGVGAADVDLAHGIARVSGSARAAPIMLAALIAADYEAESLSTGAGAKAEHARHGDVPTGTTRESGGYCH